MNWKNILIGVVIDVALFGGCSYLVHNVSFQKKEDLTPAAATKAAVPSVTKTNSKE